MEANDAMELGEARNVQVDEAEAEETRTGVFDVGRPDQLDSITPFPNAEQAPVVVGAGEVEQDVDSAQGATDENDDSGYQGLLATYYLLCSEPSIVNFEVLSRLNIAHLQDELMKIQPYENEEDGINTALQSGRVEDLLHRYSQYRFQNRLFAVAKMSLRSHRDSRP